MSIIIANAGGSSVTTSDNKKSGFAVLVRSVVFGLCTLSTAASADTLFGLHGSAHLWQPELGGTIGQTATAFNFSTEFDSQDADSTSILLALEHAVPLLPNIQLRTTPLSWAGSSESATGSLGGIINFSGQVDAEVDLNSVDGTLYYEVLDNWVSLDLGLTARWLDGFVAATELSGLSDRLGINQVIPMAYGHARFDLPFSGLAAGLRGNIIAFQDNNLTDLEAYLHLEVDLIPLLDVGIQGGFRNLSLEVEDIDDWESDAELEGAYIALTGHF